MADGDRKDKDRNDEPNPEYENFQRFLEGALSVPKKELDRRRKEYERKREQEKRAG